MITNKPKTLTASYYGPKYDGRPTASGEIYDHRKLTCASWDYPLGTVLKVTRGKTSINVVCNDRGPAKSLLSTRQLDLSQRSFAMLAPLTKGLILVQVEVVK
jgi:rare lipoprotein A